MQQRRPGPQLDQNVLARYAAVTRASILGLSGGLFSAAARLGQRPATLFGANVALEKSGLETNAENEARSAVHRQNCSAHEIKDLRSA